MKHLGATEAAVSEFPIRFRLKRSRRVLEKGARLIEQDVIEFCLDCMAVHKPFRYLEFIEGLPRKSAARRSRES